MLSKRRSIFFPLPHYRKENTKKVSQLRQQNQKKEKKYKPNVAKVFD